MARKVQGMMDDMERWRPLIEMRDRIRREKAERKEREQAAYTAWLERRKAQELP